MADDIAPRCSSAPKAAVTLVKDIIAGGWPPEWIETQCDTFGDFTLWRVGIDDPSSGDRWSACWVLKEGRRWRFSYASDLDGMMTLTALRSFVCNGPMERL